MAKKKKSNLSDAQYQKMYGRPKDTSSKAGTKTKSQSSVSSKKTSKPISSGFTVGYRSPKANANNTSRSTSTSRNVTSQDRINQKSYGATRRGTTPTAAYRQRTTPATSAEMRRQNAAANNNLKQTQAEKSRNEQKQRFNTAKEMMSARRRTNEQAKAQNAKEWEGVKNTSKEEQQAWFTKKAQEAQQRRTGKVEKGTDNLATSAAKSAFHGAKGAVHSLYGALTRASIQDEYDTQRDKALAALRGESNLDQVEKEARKKAQDRKELKLEGIRAKTLLEQQKVEELKEQEGAKDKGPIPFRKWTVGAASLTGQRVVDTALLGPYSLASMGARVLEDERNSGKERNERLKKRLMESGNFTQEELDREFDRIDKRSVANAYASAGIEIISELTFGGFGLSKQYIPKGASGLLDKTVGKLFGNMGKSVAGQMVLGNLEEAAEEWWANPAQSGVSNFLTGNRLQSLQEENVRREYQKQAMDLKEMQATSADINSDAFLERAKEIYKESGATDKEASKIAELARDYFNADIIGDSDTAEAKLSEITNILAGGENDLKEKWTLKDAIDVTGEIFISGGAEGFAGAISSSAAGNEYKANYGIEGVRKLAKVVENLDADKSDRAKAIIDDIDNGKDITGTQVSQIMEWSNETALKAQDREITRDNLVQNRMKDEKLFVPIVDSEYNLSPATDARFEEISDRVVDNIDNMGIKMSDVDAYAIADVVAAYETGTISAEQMNELNVENPEARAVFERETGINLDQYTVKDKRGNIKVAESNIKMQKALFSNAADNYMASARIEQENWNNVERGRAAESLTSDMDGMGGVGIQRVLESVDPRNRGDFMLAGSVARRVYDHARLTNDSWEDVRKDFKNAFPGASMDESMRYVYDMAKRTKTIAETQYYGKQVSNKQSLADSETMYVPGNFTNNSERMLGNTELSTLTNMATTLGVNIVMSDNMANKNANGSYDSSTRTITLNADKSMGEMLQFVLAHEVTHHLAAYAPDEYLKLSRFVMDKAYKADAEKFETAIKNIQKKYKDQAKQDLTPEQALEEIIADNAHEFWQDEAFINDVTSEEPTLAQSIINAIKDILNKLRRVLASGNITDENDRQFLFDEIDSYDQTYKLWINAFRVARNSQANQAINDWQDEVNAQSGSTERLSISSQQDADYMKAVESGDMETAQRMVDEAAKASGGYTENGNIVHLFHGTNAFGFTEFDLSKTDDGISIFLTSDKKTATTYSGTDNQRSISEKSDVKLDTYEEIEEALNKYDPNKNYSESEYKYYDSEAIEQFVQDTNNELSVFIEEMNDLLNNHSDIMSKEDIERFETMREQAKSDDPLLITNLWFSSPEYAGKHAEDYQRYYDAINMITDPLELEKHLRLREKLNEDWHPEGLFIESQLNGYSYEVISPETAKGMAEQFAGSGIYDLYTTFSNPLVIDNKENDNWNSIRVPKELQQDMWDFFGHQFSATRTRNYAQYAKAKGYDGVIFKGIRDNGGRNYGTNEVSGDVFIVFNPNEVKSADPVTYADDGSVIPLSERFNPENNDIRYSLPTQDSEDAILTDGQMEYFRNSQARDREGRLVPVFHATFRGGFTVFNPTYSDDKRSLFFAASKDISLTYGGIDANRPIDLEAGEQQRGYYECYLNLENPMIVDADGAEWDDIIPGGSKIDREASVMIRNAAHYRRIAEGVKDADVVQERLKKAEELEKNNSVEFHIFNGSDSEMDAFTISYDEELAAERINEYFGLEKDDDFGHDIASELLDEVKDSGFSQYSGPDMRALLDEFSYTTRELAELAEDEGHDGVIFRNLRDIGGMSDGIRLKNEITDVYVAFSSNQVKDVNNLNPTENPDIRYSFSDEDEAKSKIAYDDAIDNSFEALEYYGQRLADLTDEAAENRPIKRFNEDRINEFYAGLKADDSVPYSDYVLEEDRVRMAKSKNDYFNNINAKWNDRWTTDGEVLNVKSVKTDVRNLIMGVMSNSDTDSQYKRELVNKTLFDIRTAYQLMKQDRPEVASALLYHSAQRMIDNVEFYVDGTFDQYKDLKDYLRNTKISIGEEYWADVEYDAFRKRNFGRMKLVKGRTNVDQVYQQLEEMFPEWFNEEEAMDVPSQLLEIEHVIDSVQPYKEAYSSEAAAELAFDIADDLYEIMVNGDEVRSLADTYKARYDEKTMAMKQRHAEAMLRVRRARDEGIQAERAKFREYKEQQREKATHRKEFDSIQKSYDTLTKRLLDNTADSNIPEQYKKDLARLLAAFDLQTVGSKRREARTGWKAQKTIKLEAMRTALKSIENRTDDFYVNDSITDIIDSLLGLDSSNPSASIEGKTIDALNASELKKIDNLLKALVHEFNTYKNVRINARNQQAQDIADVQVRSALDHADKFGAGTDWFGIRGGLDKILNLDEVTPAYLFRQIDRKTEGLGLMWKELERAQDKYIRNTDQLSKWMEEITGKYHNKGRGNNKYGAAQIEEWRRSRSQVVFNLTNGSIKLTPAQMMSVACLANRPQAYQHMVGAGVVVAPVGFQAKMETDLKRKSNRALPLILTDADIKLIVEQLTPEQKKMAEDLQQLMSNQMAEWGNEASMDVIGIRLFEEKDYFPIKSDRAALERDLTPDQFEQAIRNFGFTKAVQPNARNAIMIDDIFDVVTEHCNNMNLYNSYSKALNDFMKVYNKHTYQEDGSDYSVAQALGHAYSQKVPKFIMTFVQDLNGNVSRGRDTGIESMLQTQLANAKKASVFANVRVLLQQPTAITRAFAVINPKYLKGIKIERGAMEEMFEHCPIAKWKSWGYYDINMGKQIEDIIMNEGNFLNDLATQAYGAADNVTWTAIWQMVKAEMKDTHPDVEIGTDEYWSLCNERMREIVDLTQVVDSPMHRSHAMRDKSFIVKMATSFMAEPTLTFNMVRDGYIRAREAWAQGNKKEAVGIMNKTMSVYVLQAAAVAAAAAIADALRGKSPDGGDDDEDKTFFASWWANTIANFQDELKLWNKIYYAKDISSIFEGYEAWNLGTQGITNIVKGYNQMTKKLTEGSKTPWWNIYQNLFGGFGYMLGIPIKTMMKDGRAVFEALGGQLPEEWIGDNKKSEPVVDKDSAFGKILSNDTSITVKEGSALDALFGKFGLEVSSTKKAASSDSKKSEDGKEESKDPTQRTREEERDKLRDLEAKAKEKAEGLSGSELDEALWDVLSDGYTKELDAGNLDYIEHLELIYMNAGGDTEVFRAKIKEKISSSYKKSFKDEMSQEELYDQDRMRHYMEELLDYSDEEVSEICYKTNTARDLKVAFRLNNEEYINNELSILVRAGLSDADLEKLYKNRNRLNLKTYSGKYKDKLKSTGNYVFPVDGIITSDFGHRSSPGGIGSTNHQGIDIGASQGTPVAAADGGVVVMAGWYGGYGKTVQVKHDDGTITQYSHLSWWDVNEGDTVAQGQEVGLVGSTGNSTGPHLHFGVLKNGEYVDPKSYINTADKQWDTSA